MLSWWHFLKGIITRCLIILFKLFFYCIITASENVRGNLYIFIWMFLIVVSYATWRQRNDNQSQIHIVDRTTRLPCWILSLQQLDHFHYQTLPACPLYALNLIPSPLSQPLDGISTDGQDSSDLISQLAWDIVIARLWLMSDKASWNATFFVFIQHDIWTNSWCLDECTITWSEHSTSDGVFM